MLEAITVIRANDYREMPWRNGRGITEEIFLEPAPGGFAWRLSRAVVAEDGPFSPFPGCDRTLFLLDTQGLELQLPDRTVRLVERYDRLDFPGDVTVVARLVEGVAASVLNMIVDRSRARAHVALMRIGPAPLALPAAPILAIHAVGGSLSLARSPVEEPVTIDPGDTLIDRSGRPGWLQSALGDLDAAAMVAAVSRTLPNS